MSHNNKICEIYKLLLWVKISGGITVYYSDYVNKIYTFTQTKYDVVQII